MVWALQDPNLNGLWEKLHELIGPRGAHDGFAVRESKAPFDKCADSCELGIVWMS